LANQILQYPNSLTYAGLTGLTLGNPVISCVTANYVAIQFNLFYWHGLVSHTLYANWTANSCDQILFKPACNYILGEAIQQIGVIYQQTFKDGAFDTNQPSLDPDDLYQDFCTGNGTLEFTEDTGYPDSCNPIGNRLVNYLNQKSVQEALGVPSTQWAECTNNINYTTSGASMIPYYQSFFKIRPDLNILIYSGDVDVYTVPFGYTSACLQELNNKPNVQWQPWFVNGATAGYVEVYDRFTYATVKGAGHETPQYQPLSAYNMFYDFVTKGKLNTTGVRKLNKRFFGRRTQGSILKEHGIRG